MQVLKEDRDQENLDERDACCSGCESLCGVRDSRLRSHGRWLVRLLADVGRTVWDRQGWISRARDCRAIARTTPSRKIYVSNLGEALVEFGINSESPLQDWLPPRGFTQAVIKRGGEGCTAIESDLGKMVPRM